MNLTKNEKYAIWGLVSITTITLIIIYRKGIKSKLESGMQSISNFIESLKNTALSEWEFWNKGSIKEGDSKTMERLREYWKEGAGVKNWSDSQMKNEAWSAAFISYVMKKSGAGSDFKYSPSHSTYIVDSIKNRKQNNDKPFKGFRPEEVKLGIGDLVGFAREGGINYDTIGSYKSHTDIVVDIKDGFAETIGGNVSNSVTKTLVPLTKYGKIDTSTEKGKKYFVVIKNLKNKKFYL
jgi:hypothetical protein